ncbi:phage exclusion protein Lit family protein [Paraburkholderia sp. D15]|uniref:phage exclusion protein Lit family protein n=1 Tax=Paraburkholderia sp. D15 TaxID=2880218 RepID=UPI00247878AB|nr:phage exclusion protein Lit family protein [Paraburkholderia sp. D15]WGS50123.1 phage exclusion protein Lit family protein [Paraburkholderia sp. D15]
MRNEHDSPVLALEHNVTWAFEHATPYAGARLAEAVASGVVAPEIGLNFDDSTAPPKGPFLQRRGKTDVPEMHISLKHLELLWSFTYSWMVIYERGIQTPLIEGKWVGEVDSSDPVLRRALRLRDWSASLQTRCTPWPQELPSPRSYACEIERWYGEKANLVFQQATAFLLGHEFAHAAGGHLDFVPANAPDCDAIEAEQDADVAAFSSLVESTDDDSEKLSKAWAILSALLSTMYLGEETRTPFVQKRHPPLHHRLSNFTRMLDFEKEQYRYYFPMLTCIVLEWALVELDSIPRSASLYEDAEEAFSDTLDRIENWIKQH